MRSRVYSIFFFLLLPMLMLGYVQENNASFIVQGKVIDATNGSIIPYCGIKVLNLTTGTASNELGEFELRVNEFPVTLTFSHINFEDYQLTISEATDVLEIRLNPLLNLLETVVLETPKLKNDPNASKLAKRVYRKVSSRLNRELKYGKAFYRQKTKTDNLYTEFSEILFDAEYNGGGVLKWDILEGRYALNEAGVNNKNYTRLTQILKGFQPDTEDIIFPLHPELEEHYYVNFKDRFNANGDEIVILKFTPRNPLETPIFRGEAYINTASDELLKLSCIVRNDKLDLVSLTEKNAQKKNYMLAFDLVFKTDDIQGQVLDYLKVDQEFDYFKDDTFFSHVSSTSNLTFIEHYITTERRRLGRQFRRNNSDWQNLDQIGYNSAYWENNPIVKRTPIEAEVIEAFEKDNAFESIFLNSKDEITVIQSRITQDSLIQNMERLLDGYNEALPVEKVYLHTDKKVVGVGDNLWYSAYVVLGPLHNYSSASKTLHVELINNDGELVLEQKKRLYDGTSLGNFTIAKDIPSGNYELRAYTNWMKDTAPEKLFRKTIIVDNPLQPEAVETASSELDIQFLPEGGYIIAGLRNRVALKVCNTNGLPQAVSGQIVDSKGNFVTRFQASAGGMGTFTILPLAGETYMAKLDNGTNYDLPNTMISGYNMFVNNLDLGTIQVRIQATADIRDRDIYLIGSVRNYKFFQGKYNLKNRPFIDIEVPKNRFPSGIVTLTLVDKEMRPWSERIVFINHKNELNITAEMSNSVHRDSVNLQISVKDFSDAPVAANLSLGITNTNQIKKRDSQSNILSYLLLESDLKGEIGDPNMFLNDTSRRTQYGLDLIMLTHGWRKFNWLMEGNNSLNVSDYQFNDSYSISGTVTAKDNVPLRNTDLDLIVKTSSEILMYSTKTGDAGEFTFEGMNHLGEFELTFNAYDQKRKPLESEVSLSEESIMKLGPICISTLNANQDIDTNIMDQEYLNNVIEGFELEQDGVTALDEVVVEGRKKERVKLTPSFMNAEADDVIFVEEKDPDLMSVLNRGSGVFMTGDPQQPKIRIQGVGDVIWVIDGITIAPNTSIEAGGADRLASPTLNSMISPSPAPIAIRSLDVNNIERVEIIKGPRVSMLGARGIGAAILIYTKTGGTNPSKTIDSPQLNTAGFALERSFYIPKYLKVNNTNYSATHFWKGAVLTDDNGNATITIPRLSSGEFQLAIEALSFNGLPGYLLETIKQ